MGFVRPGLNHFFYSQRYSFVSEQTDIEVKEICKISKNEFLKSAFLLLNSSLFWDITQRSVVPTDVWGESIGRIFKGQVVLHQAVLNCFNLEDGTNRLYRNVGNCYSMLRNVSEERRPHLHRSGSLEIRFVLSFPYQIVTPRRSFLTRRPRGTCR
jgi:hypothetical protein